MTTYKESVLSAREDFLKLSSRQEKKLLQLYVELSKQLKTDILNCRTTSQERYLKNLDEIVKANIQELNGELNKIIKSNIDTSSQIASSVDSAYYKAITEEVGLQAIFQSTVLNNSRATVSKLIQGKFYEDKTSLDARLWRISNKSIKDIDTLIKVNVLKGANAKELAKQVEQYVNPTKKLNIVNDYVGFNKNVSYQSARLARTSITTAFRETQIQEAMDNPFNIAMHWQLSSEHGTRMHGKTDICDSYTNDDSYGLGTGNFPSAKLPIGHPNCLCNTYEINVPIDDAIARLKAWNNGKKDKELDEWYTNHSKKVV